MTEDGPDAPEGGPESLVLAAFGDPEPLTAAEVAAATGVDVEEAEAALDGLVTAGRLGRKTVGASEGEGESEGETGDGEGVTLWYPTPGGGNGSPGDGEATAGTGRSVAFDAGGDPPAAPDAGDPSSVESEAGEGSGTADWSPDEVTMRGGGLTGDDGDAEFDETRVESALADLDVPGTSEMMRDWRRAAVRASFDYVHDHGPASSAAIVEAVYSGHRAGYGDGDAWWAFVAPRLATLPGVDRDGEEWTFTGID